MFFNPIIGMVHDVENGRWHPIVFEEAPLPGPPSADKPVRHRSKMHHTTGFDSREAAVDSARGELADRIPGARFALAADFAWDGEGIPTITTLFVERDGELIPAL